ncbi:hypothetical protein ABZ845_03235 [Streptomyces sp. NPDC047022]|uniref:hypothetical protein n=1 Tax=Streptomyces sp. NPDC047022 TaxID=3155737 RepID=UPI0034014FB6
MSEYDELRHRLEAVEARVEEVVQQHAATRNLAVGSDQDVAALQQQRRADMQLIHALRDTQLEQGRTLKQHSELLGALVAGQVEHGGVLAEHSKILADHSKILGEHSKILGEHSKTLAEHGKTLGEHSQMLRSLTAGQAAILEHLGLAPSMPKQSH